MRQIPCDILAHVKPIFVALPCFMKRASQICLPLKFYSLTQQSTQKYDITNWGWFWTAHLLVTNRSRLLLRHECFIRKCDTPKIRATLLPGSNGVFSLSFKCRYCWRFHGGFVQTVHLSIMIRERKKIHCGLKVWILYFLEVKEIFCERVHRVLITG